MAFRSERFELRLIGTWRMVTGCLVDSAMAFAQLAYDYIRQEYEHESGRQPKAEHVSKGFGGKLEERFTQRVLTHSLLTACLLDAFAYWVSGTLKVDIQPLV